MVRGESEIECHTREALEHLSTALDRLRDILEDNMDVDVRLLRLSREERAQLLAKAESDYLYYWHYSTVFSLEAKDR